MFVSGGWEWLNCFLLSGAFVGSLYIWGEPRRNRNDPAVVRRRLISVAIASFLSIIYSYFLWRGSIAEYFAAIGIRGEGAVQAIVLPLLLTMSLFLGPLVLQYYDDELPFQHGISQWVRSTWSELHDIMTWRTLIAAPIFEEIVFRGLIVPFLKSGGYSDWNIVIYSPLLFGVAHAHHLLQSHDVLPVVIQLCYTSIFGAYSAFLFLRTGHIVAPILSHAFCNYMGFPDFGRIFEHPRRLILLPSLFAGVALFVYGFLPWTEPALYS